MSSKSKRVLMIVLSLLWGVAFCVVFMIGPFSALVGNHVFYIAILCILQIALPALLFYPAMKLMVMNLMPKVSRIVLGTLSGALTLGLSEGIVLAVNEFLKVTVRGNWDELWHNILAGMSLGGVLGLMAGIVISLAVALVLVFSKLKKDAGQA